MIDLSGSQHGRLKVIGEAERRVNEKGRSSRMWNCICVCGNNRVVEQSKITTGTTVSCGCYALSVRKTHGLSTHPLYSTWLGMRQRCKNKNHRAYKYYGGRGIKVCERWANSFATFYGDIGDKPGEHYSLERSDNNGDYTPENCVWATRSEQILNQGLRATNKSGIKGVSWDSASKVWRATFKDKKLGRYKHKIDAKCARDTAVMEHKRGLNAHQ